MSRFKTCVSVIFVLLEFAIVIISLAAHSDTSAFAKFWLPGVIGLTLVVPYLLVLFGVIHWGTKPPPKKLLDGNWDYEANCTAGPPTDRYEYQYSGHCDILVTGMKIKIQGIRTADSIKPAVSTTEKNRRKKTNTDLAIPWRSTWAVYNEQDNTIFWLFRIRIVPNHDPDDKVNMDREGFVKLNLGGLRSGLIGGDCTLFAPHTIRGTIMFTKRDSRV